MSRKSRKGAPVVIVRKDKRVNHKFLHAAAFAMTGGASAVVTAAEVANHAAYNARTAKLAGQAEDSDQGQAPAQSAPQGQAGAQYRAEHVPGSREYKARQAEEQETCQCCQNYRAGWPEAAHTVGGCPICGH